MQERGNYRKAMGKCDILIQKNSLKIISFSIDMVVGGGIVRSVIKQQTLRKGGGAYWGIKGAEKTQEESR